MKIILSTALLLPLLAASCLAQPAKAPLSKANDAVEDQGNVAPLAKGTMQDYAALAPREVPLPKSNYTVPNGAIFASPDAKIGGKGTRDSPQTLAEAIQNAPAGATIVLRGGIYRAAAISIPRQLTLQAAPGEAPLLVSSISIENWTQSANARGKVWVHDGWTADFRWTDSPRYIDAKKNPLAGYRDATFYDGKPLWQVASLEAVGPGRFFVDYEADQLYIGDDPNGHGVEGTTAFIGLLLAKPRPKVDGTQGVGDPTGSQVKGLAFARYANYGLMVARANGVTLENNVFAWNGQMGAACFESSDVTVRGNTFLCNGRKGFGGNNADRMLLEGNRVSFNNIEGYSTSWDASGVKFTRSRGMIWRNNLCEYTDAIGLWIDGSCLDTQMIENVSHHNAVGLMTELCDNTLMAFNVCYDNGGGLNITDASSSQLWNNTLVRNNQAIVVQDSPRVNNDPKNMSYGSAARAARNPWITRGTIIKNNVLVAKTGQNKDPLFNGSGNWTTGEASSLFISQSDWNLYVPAGAQKPALGWSWGTPETRHVAYPTLADFQKAMRAQKLDYEANSLVVTDENTLFVDTKNGDFRLKNGGAALVRGENLPDNIARMTGQILDAKFIGALPVANAFLP